MTALVYLDHAATSPLRPEAREALAAGFSRWANPSSPHAPGRRARAAIEEARDRIRAALQWEGELIFTSGASEAATIALVQARAGARLVSAVEHDAVRKAASDAEILPVRPDGALDLDILAEAVDRERPLVAVQQVNSETGNRQDLARIGAIVHEAGGWLLADCAQGAGREPIPPEVDMAIVSAHKLGGPVGIGALLLRDFAMIEPVGGQERGYRRGTENMPGALAMAAAIEATVQGGWMSAQAIEARERLCGRVRGAGGTWLADRLSDPAPHICALAMPAISASAQVMRFDMAGFAVSQGSACSSGRMQTSPVLAAMQLDEEIAARTIRVSFGWNTRPEDIDAFAAAWEEMAARARR